MKFELSTPFTIEVGDNVYKGTISTLTKKQSKEITSLLDTEKAAVKELRKFQMEVAILDGKLKKDPSNDKLLKELTKLTETIEAKASEAEELDTAEKAAKLRFELTVKCDEEIIELAENYGYNNVLKTIFQDIEDSKKSSTAS